MVTVSAFVLVSLLYLVVFFCFVVDACFQCSLLCSMPFLYSCFAVVLLLHAHVVSSSVSLSFVIYLCVGGFECVFIYFCSFYLLVVLVLLPPSLLVFAVHYVALFCSYDAFQFCWGYFQNACLSACLPA